SVWGSHADAFPTRQTWSSAKPSSEKPEPVTVTEAWSGRFDDGSTVTVGPGTSGPSGRNGSVARPACADVGDPALATSRHGSGAVRQSTVVPLPSPMMMALSWAGWEKLPPGVSKKSTNSQASEVGVDGHSHSSTKESPNPEPLTVTVWPSTRSVA